MVFLLEKRKVFFLYDTDINERNNELVKILQALRSKNTPNMPPPGAQKVPPEMMKQVPGSNQPKPPVIQPPNPQQQPIVPPTPSTTPKLA